MTRKRVPKKKKLDWNIRREIKGRGDDKGKADGVNRKRVFYLFTNFIYWKFYLLIIKNIKIIINNNIANNSKNNIHNNNIFNNINKHKNKKKW